MDAHDPPVPPPPSAFTVAFAALESELRSVEQIAHAQRDEISALAEHGDAMAAAHAALRKAHRASLQQNDLLEARIARLRAAVEARKT